MCIRAIQSGTSAHPWSSLFGATRPRAAIIASHGTDPGRLSHSAPSTPRPSHHHTSRCLPRITRRQSPWHLSQIQPAPRSSLSHQDRIASHTRALRDLQSLVSRAPPPRAPPIIPQEIHDGTGCDSMNGIPSHRHILALCSETKQTSRGGHPRSPLSVAISCPRSRPSPSVAAVGLHLLPSSSILRARVDLGSALCCVS